MKPVKLTENVYVISVNDRRKQLFENMWPLPRGVSYNCFVIDDEKTALLDTVEYGSSNSFLSNVDEVLKGKKLDYLIINHMEPDHSGEITSVLTKYPETKIVGNPQTYRIFKEYYGANKNFIEIKDAEEICLGKHNLKFVTTPMVHWPESMMTYETTEQILFSQDAFGCFGTLDGGIFDDEVNFDFYIEEMRRYYSNIVGKHSAMVQKAFTKLQNVPVKYICPVHGPIWRQNTHIPLNMYNEMSKYEAEKGVLILFASMYGNTGNIADYIARIIAENGIKNIRIYDVSKTHISYLIREAWKYETIVLGSCSYNNEMHPMMSMFCREMEYYGLKNRNLAIFGTYSWSGGALSNLKKFAEAINWNQIAQPLETAGKPDSEKLEKYDDFAKAVAQSAK